MSEHRDGFSCSEIEDELDDTIAAVDFVSRELNAAVRAADELRTKVLSFGALQHEWMNERDAALAAADELRATLRIARVDIVTLGRLPGSPSQGRIAAEAMQRIDAALARSVLLAGQESETGFPISDHQESCYRTAAEQESERA